jgi:hypothetical protein
VAVTAGTVGLVNDTLARNNATGGAGGAGGTPTTYSMLLPGGFGGFGGGGGLFVTSSVTALANTLIAENNAVGGAGGPGFPAGRSGGARGPDASAVVTTSDHDLIGNISGFGALSSNGNLLNKNPLLGTLQDNGGPTQTIALLEGSPAINAGDNALAVDPQGNPLTTDQRSAGFARISGGTVDIGAFEVQTTDTTVALTASSSPSVYGQAVTLTATVSLTLSGTQATAGTVTFLDGSTVLARGVPVSASGQATFSTSGLTAGTHALLAKYSGATGTLSTPGALSQVVNPLAVTLSGSRPYDGTTTAAAGILSIANRVGSDQVTLSGSATLAGANVGSQAISSFAGLQLGGTAAANYTLTGASGSVTVQVNQTLTILQAYQSIYSPNGQYQLIMQGDGNLVEYGPGGLVMWNAGTWGNPGAYAIMQGDGNLVVYSPAGAALWNSGTSGNPGAFFRLQNDGNALIYRADGTALWYGNSMMWPGRVLTAGQVIYTLNGQYHLIMQGDGNLVEYGPGGQAIWNAGTWGNPGAYAIMQGDGNLVVYSSAGTALWNSGTYGHAGASLALGDGGTLEIAYQGTVIWSV